MEHIYDVSGTIVMNDLKYWLECLFQPTDIIEIRCFPSKTVSDVFPSRRYSWSATWRHLGFEPWMLLGQVQRQMERLINFNEGVKTRWGTPDKKTNRLTSFETIDGVPLNIYCSANPRRCAGGTKQEHVALARCLFADFDDVTVDEMTEALQAARLPTPTLSMWSGNGVHAYWRLVAPLDNLRVWTAFQKRLIHALGSDPTIHDPPRVMRLPGFINHKEAKAKVYLVDAEPNRRYDLEFFDGLLPILPTRTRRAKEPRAVHLLTDVSPAVTSVPDDEKMRQATAYMERFSPPEEGNRNSKMFDLAANLTERFDLPQKQLLDLVNVFNNKCGNPLDHHEVGEVAAKGFRHIYKQGKKRGTALIEPIQAQSPQEPKGGVIPLAEWRMQMVQSRLGSLQQPGTIHFDGSPPGAGKSTADLEAMKVAGQSMTLLPTHQGCRDVAESLEQVGLKAASYPPINEETCLIFGTKTSPGEARITQEAGLNVGSALCPDCRHRRSCEYQKQRQVAGTAHHAIATHARSVTSGFQPALGKPILFIHENFLNLLRPTVRISAQPTRGGASVRHLLDIAKVAREAFHRAKSLGDEEKQRFFPHLYRSSLDLAEKLDETQNALEKVTAIVEQLPIKDRQDRPDRWELVVWQAMRDAGLHVHGDALRLCLAHACGELETLCLVLDDKYSRENSPQKAEKHVVPSLVGVWRVDPPSNSVVWFEDGTGHVELLRQLTGRHVVDDTPQGRLAWAVPPVQYTQDVTRSTSPGVFRSILRGVLCKYRDAERVGVILHRPHYTALNDLEPEWKERLALIDHFGSGTDRASNAWLDCDLIVIAGTARVSTATVRQCLIQIGDIKAAGENGQWSKHAWVKKNTEGTSCTITSLGYKHPAWRKAHEILVRDAMIQAVGRGRGIIEKGVPVVVISNEPLGLPNASGPLPLLTDELASVYSAFRKLTEESANIYSLGNTSVSTKDVAHLVGLCERQTRTHLGTLAHPSFGLLTRKGERGGWLPLLHWRDLQSRCG